MTAREDAAEYRTAEAARIAQEFQRELRWLLPEWMSRDIGQKRIDIENALIDVADKIADIRAGYPALVREHFEEHEPA